MAPVCPEHYPGRLVAGEQVPGPDRQLYFLDDARVRPLARIRCNAARFARRASADTPLPPRPVTLGNDGTAEIQVGGPGVEPRHAEININAKGYTLVDLGSKLGTLVNAEPVQERLLRHEDVIQIGAARYVFREG